MDQSYEITIKKETNPEELKKTINQQQVIIDGKTLAITPTRKLKDRRNTITKVLIFEAPYELEDKHIITKLSPYGILQIKNKIFNHKYRGTEIYNGVRSVNFTTIVKPIPTTLFVRGNRLKLKHVGQDITPICGICKERGHYRNKCPRKETYTVRDNLDENRQEQETWSNIVKQGVQQRKREEEQRKLYMEEIKKQDEQNKRKRRQEEVLQDDLTQRLNQIINENEDQEEPWRTVEDAAKKKRRKNRRKKKKEEEKVKHQQIQLHLHRRVNMKPRKTKMIQKFPTVPTIRKDETAQIPKLT